MSGQVRFDQRDVYYLLHGIGRSHQKICLVHGSFFETVPAGELMEETIKQILEASLSGLDIAEKMKDKVRKVFMRPDLFERISNVETGATVKLRVEPEAEVKPEANILNPNHYPEIRDDTLNLVCPFHTNDEKGELLAKMESVLGADKFRSLDLFQIKHPFNGHFLVFQSILQ